MMSGWIGVDLDGTLAHYSGWKGPDQIGEPIEAMLVRVHDWINRGVEVRIFTARASVPEHIRPVRAWLEKHFGDKAMLIGITNIKDFRMIELWDDRCVRVLPNTGNPCCKAD